jgi:hypothetical protein
MAKPFLDPFLIEHSCKSCPEKFSSSLTDVENDEISCNGECPKGMYYDGDGIGCQDCVAGKFNDIEGSTGSSSCKACELGMYSINPGSEACENCLGGKTTEDTGRFKTTDCKDCDAGKHSTGKDGFTTCEDCDLASYSDMGSSVCLKCDPGQYMPTGNPRSCLECAPGRFSNYGKVQCTDCDQGQYAVKLIDSELVKCPKGCTGCKSCPAGQYGSDAAKSVVELRIDMDGACNECGVGKYSFAEGAKLETSCIDCQPGKKAKDIQVARTEETEACTDCLVGRYRSSTDTDLTKCIDCTLGTYADAKGLTKCLACPAGTHSDVHVTQSVVDAFKDGEGFCKDCVVGKHRPSKDENGVATDLTECK